MLPKAQLGRIKTWIGFRDVVKAAAITAGFAGMTILIGVAGEGCTQAKQDVVLGGHAWYDCAKADLTQVVTKDGLSILAEVAKDVEAGGAGWQGDLEAAGAKAGELALACAVQSVETVLSSHPDQKTATTLSPSVVRAQGLIQSKGWKFRP